MPIDTATCWRIFCARKLTSMGKNTTGFQQDGATVHTARRPRAILKMFPGRVVSLHEAVPWPPRSPDLSPCDFSVGVLQGRGFQTSSSVLGPTKGGNSRRTAPNVYLPSRPPFGRYHFENLK
jgi:hypothetical protein